MAKSIFPRMVALFASMLLIVAACGGSADDNGSAKDNGDLGTIGVAIGTQNTFEFIPTTLGVKLGVWKKRGLKIKNINVQGSAQVAQAVAAGQADMGVTAGASGVDGILSGVKAKIVGLIGKDFNMMVLVVPANSGIESVKDLKGGAVGVTSAGSLTDYLASVIAQDQGWPKSAIKRAAIGGLSENLAALESGTTDAFIWSAEAGIALEEQGKGRVLLNFGKMMGDNVFEATLASDDTIKNRPDAVRAYLEGWYETVEYMAAHRDETIDYMTKTFQVSKIVAAKTYDLDMSNLSTDGTIPKENLQGLAQSVVDMGVVKDTPDIETFWDSQFVPVSVN